MRGVAAALLLLLLAGCAGIPLEPAATPSSVTVRAGDTIYDIAERYDVPQRDIIELNGLSPPYELRAGQVLRLPAPRIHRVARGDTLYGISRRYRVGMTELARINDILPPYRIYMGQELRLPSSAGAQQAAGILRPPLPRPRPVISATTVATAPSSQPVVAARAPQPAAPAPAMPAPQPVAPAPPPPVAAIPAPVPERRPDPALPPSQTAAVSPTPPTADPPPRAGGRFVWPVTGEIVSGFGPKGEGAHNDGINIAAERGTPVHAAENGIVAYAGNELRGYGNLVLIRHADGWVTAYGHNDQVLVSRGEQVTAGQTIATVGATGAVNTPQLHFEIRRGTQAMDPMEHLPAMP